VLCGYGFFVSPSDQGVCFAIQRGIEASRSKVKYFRHNDMTHLESLLEEKLQQEKKVKNLLLWKYLYNFKQDNYTSEAYFRSCCASVISIPWYIKIPVYYPAVL